MRIVTETDKDDEEDVDEDEDEAAIAARALRMKGPSSEAISKFEDEGKYLSTHDWYPTLT